MTTSEGFVKARTCTLLASSSSEASLLNRQTYVIPVYQRPLAWGENQVQRLLAGFWNAYQSQEPYFIGTLLLIPRTTDEWEVVDGQQRLTTLLLLCQVAKWQYGEEVLPVELRRLDWLRTQVSSQEQQKWLAEVLAYAKLPTRPATPSQNPYLRNAFFIYDWLTGQETQAGEDSRGFEPTAFFAFLVATVHVVAIETRSGLAKALDIFNTINTTGLPLTGDDLFKIRLYDYLTLGKALTDDEKQAALHEIDAFYAHIVTRNKVAGYGVTSPDQILRIYQRILIERAGLNRTLHESGPDRFYERVFEAVLLGRSQGLDADKLRTALGPNPLADLNRLVEMRFLWDKGFSIRHDLWHDLQDRTRYGWRFEFLDIIYLFRFYDAEFAATKPKFELWKELMVKFYIIKTLEAAKVVNDGRTFTYQVIREILRPEATPDTLLAQVRRKLHEYPRQWFVTDRLQGDVFENAARRDLTSRLSALLAEEPNWQTGWENSALRQLILGKVNYEVEHIHPRNPSAAFSSPEDWGVAQLNSLGNLTLLEGELNRRVLNHPLHQKQLTYKESVLAEVQQLLGHPDAYWTLSACEARTQKKAQTLADFLFGEGHYTSLPF